MVAPSYRENTLEFVADKNNILLINRSFSSYFLAELKHVLITVSESNPQFHH